MARYTKGALERVFGEVEECSGNNWRGIDYMQLAKAQ